MIFALAGERNDRLIGTMPVCQALIDRIIVLYKISEVHIELYTDCKDLSVERQLEAVLDQHGIFYEKTETWIESERLYEVLYYFEMEV